MKTDKKFVLSHSKMECCLNNPMDYNLNYKIGIKPKETKRCFQVGSAMHWGFENDTEDLTQWFQENGDLSQQVEKSFEQRQAEAMCHGYFSHKKEIFDEVLKDYDTGERVELLGDESIYHELELTAKIPSAKDKTKSYDFIAIIDLLILTKKGFIIIDYKSSSEIPDFNKYLDQIYRYDFVLRQNFPGVPIYKIGIINLVKSRIRKASDESIEDYEKRWCWQYDKYPNPLINVKMFEKSKLDENVISDYIDNLSKEADLVNAIDENGLYYINFKGAKEPYKSVYYDIYYGTQDAYRLYTIKDTIFDVSTQKIINRRDCVESDMLIPTKGDVMFRYDDFAKERMENADVDDKTFFEYIHSKYEISDDLLLMYQQTFNFLVLRK